MSARRFSDFESEVDEFIDSQDNLSDNNLSTKLERRRRIEELQEEKLLREEIEDFS